jgi:hypothetical protein
VFTGKAWMSEPAQKYDIRIIPTPLLVDGDTGHLLALRNDLLDANLDKTLHKVFAGKRP